MSETNLQRRLQRLIMTKGGYIPGKNHGSMITERGIADLSFTYNGLSVYWEVKTPSEYQGLLRMRKNRTLDSRAIAQGIHCRLAKKAGGITAILSSIEEAKLILDSIDYCINSNYSVKQCLVTLEALYKERGLDDGTSSNI